MNTNRARSTYRVRGIVIVTMLGALILSPTIASAAATQAAKELSNAFSAAAKAAMPAVVSIKVEKAVAVDPAAFGGSPFGFNDPFGLFGDDLRQRFFGDRAPQQGQAPRKYREQGQGSGFIISPDGYILTNNHVVGDVDKITVELQDGRKFENAKLIGTDPDSEVALIKIDGDNFPVLPLGNSDRIEIGDWVIAIGNPFGLNETVTVGVISAVGRSNVHIAAYEDFIQTDAAINPGNSGGPLVNLDGQVIGINTAIMSQSGGYMGIGFAIPINMARSIEQQLKTSGKVSRGYLGMYGQDVTEEMAQLLKLKSNHGVIVAQVEPGSPAAKAGLQNNDVIVELNGANVESYDVFRNEVATLAPGSKANLVVLRGSKELRMTIVLGERPTQLAAQGPTEKQRQSKEAFGMEVQNLSDDLAQQLGYALGTGVVISAVEPGGPAAEAGLEPGDLIRSVNQQTVNSVDELEKVIAAAKGDKVIMLVRHGEYSRFVVLQRTK